MSSVSLIPLNEYLSSRPHESKCELIQSKLLLWCWICVAFTFSIPDSWIVAYPRGPFGGNDRFRMNLHEICVVLPPNDLQWIFKPSIGGDEKVLSPEKQLPFLMPEMENILANTWQPDLKCFPLEDEVMSLWWILFPLKYGGFSLNQIANFLLTMLLVAIPLYLLLISWRLASPRWSHLYFSSNFSDQRIVGFIDCSFFCLDFIIAVLVGGAAFATDSFFLPVRTLLTTSSFLCERGLSQLTMWLAASLSFASLAMAVQRMCGNVRNMAVVTHYCSTAEEND